MRLAVWLIERPRWFKRALLMINDLAMLSIAVWAAYTLRLSRLYVPNGLDKWRHGGRNQARFATAQKGVSGIQ